MTENNKETLGLDDNKSTASSAKSDEKAINFLDGIRNPSDEATPTTTNAPLVDEEGFIIRPEEKPEKNQWSSCTSSGMFCLFVSNVHDYFFKS
uniref:Uncharacterized protein n=1 Tax=Panagrolaimus sp. ES5 TaxID=591445 RepID=A0AC34FR31_9BILA